MGYLIVQRGIPKTGQAEVVSAGDDGDMQRGYEPPGGRFVDNGDGTAFDRNTKLTVVRAPQLMVPDLTAAQIANGAVYPPNRMANPAGKGNWSSLTDYALGDVVANDVAMWICVQAHFATAENEPLVATEDTNGFWVRTLWCGDGQDPAPDPLVATQWSWVEALSACSGLNYADRDDWRMPNVYEMALLVAQGGDWHDDTLFAHLSAAWNDYYWTSTKAESGKANHIVTFGKLYISSKTISNTDGVVLPVRGGQT